MNFKQIDKPKSNQTSYSSVYYGASGSAPAQKIDYLELNEKQLSVSSGIVKRKVISEIGNIQSGDTAMYLFDDNAFIFVLTNSGTNESVGGFDSDGAFFSKKISLIDNNNDTITLNALDGYLNVSGNTLNQIPTIQGKINGLNEQLLLNPDGGNIIIGQTTNTGQKLQVNGNIKSSGLLLSNEKGNYLIEGDYNGLKVNGNAIGAKIYKYSELNTYTFTDEDVSNSFNAYTIKKIINDKYNATGGTINGDVNITGNLTVNGSSITNITNTQIINALGYTPYNATNPNNYITANHSGSITATGFIKNGGTSSQFLKADGSVDNNNYITANHSGNITATGFIKNGGTSSQFLKANGTVDNNTYITANHSGNITATAFIKNGGTSSQFLKANGTVDNTSYLPASAVGGLEVNTAKKLRIDNTIVNGASGLQFAQYSGGDNPGGEWYSHLIMNYDNVNGYYIDLLSSFNSDVMYMRRKVNGVVSTDRRFMMYDDTASLSQLTVGTGSNAKVTISDGGYIGIDSINANDNLILRAKGAGGLLLNYGSIGGYVGFYSGTNRMAYINSSGTAHFGGNLTINGNANFSGSLTTSELFDTSRKKQYVFENYSGGWVRIAKLTVPSTGEAVGTISITNTYGYSHPVSTVFSFGVTYRDIEPWVTQMGATNTTLPKVRIVSPTNANTDYYIEVYYTAVGGPNLFYIQLSNEHNVELLNSFTNGEVPAGYVGREYNMNQFGMSTNSILVGNIWNSNNRIEVNDAGYLSLTTHENELTIGKTHASEALFINYRQPKTGSAPTTYIWNNGTSTGYADHRVGSLTANAIRFNNDYTTNYISGDSLGMVFSGPQYVYFGQTQSTYFANQIIARGGITNDSGNYVALNKQTYVDGHIEFKNKLQSLDTGILAGNTAFQIRGVGESGVYASGIAFDTFNIESGESSYSYKERMSIFSNGNVAIGTTTNFGYKLNVNGSTRLAGTLNVTGAITVASTTKVNNLHVDKVDGFDFWSGSKSAYDAITTKSSTTIYIIT